MKDVVGARKEWIGRRGRTNLKKYLTFEEQFVSKNIHTREEAVGSRSSLIFLEVKKLDSRAAIRK